MGSGENIGVLDIYWLFGKNGIGFANPPYIPNDVYVAGFPMGSETKTF